MGGNAFSFKKLLTKKKSYYILYTSKGVNQDICIVGIASKPSRKEAPIMAAKKPAKKAAPKKAVLQKKTAKKPAKKKC